MDQARNVGATFTASSAGPYTINVYKAGTGTGLVSSTAGSGLYCGSVCSVAYNNGTSVTLTAAATTGSTFAGWSGDCSGTAATCTVTMDQARNVGATFTASAVSSYILTVNKSGTGLGVVSSTAGSGLYCGSVCSVAYPNGTSVTLTAAAATGSTFAGWSGDCSGTAATCTVTMNQARNVGATFTAAPTVVAPTQSSPSGYQVVTTLTPQLSWSGGSGIGSVQVYMSKAPYGSSYVIYQSAWLSPGTTLVTSTTLAAGTSYRWDMQACSGANGSGTCVYSSSEAYFSTQTAAPAGPYTINVYIAGTGTGVVSSSAGSGLYCGSTCSVVYTNGTSVTLTATAITGSTFAGWSGDCSGTAATCTVTMNQARNVGATFTMNNGGTSNTAPFGYLDKPDTNTNVSGLLLVTGWVLDQEDTNLTVELLLDGHAVSPRVANSGAPGPTRAARADVCADARYSNIGTCSSSKPGFVFNWYTTTVANGNYTLAIRVTDPGGLAKVFGDRTITVKNVRSSTLGSAIVSEAVIHNGYVSGPNPRSPTDSRVGLCNMFSKFWVRDCELWCADFVGYVWQQAGAANTSVLDAGALSFYTYGHNNNTWKDGAENQTVAPGDAVVWGIGFSRDFPGEGQHVGIVLAVNGDDRLDVISGDSGLNPDGSTNVSIEKNMLRSEKIPWNNTNINAWILGYTSAVQ
jgi:hypothetical protein